MLPDDPEVFLLELLSDRVDARAPSSPLSPLSPAVHRMRKQRAKGAGKLNTPPPSRATSIAVGSDAMRAMQQLQGPLGADLSKLGGMLEALGEGGEDEEDEEDEGQGRASMTSLDGEEAQRPGDVGGARGRGDSDGVAPAGGGGGAPRLVPPLRVEGQEAKLELRLLQTRPRLDSEVDEILAHAALRACTSPAVGPAPPPGARGADAKDIMDGDAKDFQL